MPRGPRGEKRPADVVGAAIMVAKFATGEITETDDGKDPAAESMGRKGGRARAASMTAERRAEIARRAAAAHWAKRKTGRTKLRTRGSTRVVPRSARSSLAKVFAGPHFRVAGVPNVFGFFPQVPQVPQAPRAGRALVVDGSPL
jgi:hypothetical protein